VLPLTIMAEAGFAQAKIDIPQMASTTCAVMSGERKADRQAIQYLLQMDEDVGEGNPIAIALQRQVIKQCPKAYLNYEQRKRTSNPVPPGLLVKPSVSLTKPGVSLTKPGVLLTKPGVSLTNPGTSLTQPGRALTQSGKELQISETDKEIRVAIAADVLFDFDKATIRPDAASALKQVAAVIRKENHHTVRIEGHTDSKGSKAHNMRLSDQRAIAVKTWLATNEGISVAMFSTRGFGATRPVASNTKPDGSDNPDGRRLNRRVEMIIAR
jgi:outer membrane protein OmpA-like peptidoglycan-associated protein